jgi:sucrose-6-phosphate hydrolase SacC (GH32 family)
VRRFQKFCLMGLITAIMSHLVCGAMLYHPAEGMWDSWIHTRGDEYQLFFMSGGGIGRAVSKDLIHWQPLPAIPNFASVKEGDKKEMYTGCTVKNGGQYYMFYGTGPNEPVCFLTSPDLANWQKFSGNPVLPARPPYRAGDHWRDLNVYFDEKEEQWHGYLFGIYDKTGSPCIAHVTTKDFVEWQYLEPVFISEPYSRDNNGFVELEVPEHFQINGTHYMMFCSVRSRKSCTSGLKDASGTWYLIGDRRDGPYRVPQRPLILGSAEGRFDHYVGRTFEHQGKRLLYHQAIGNIGKSPVVWSTLKEVHQNTDGTLSLKYWPGLNALRTEKIASKESLEVKAESGFRALQMLGINASDMMLTCRLDLGNIKAAALLWHDRASACQQNASGLLIDKASQTVSIIGAEYWKAYFQEFKSRTIITHVKTETQQPGLFGESVAVRVIVRGHLAEVYINDQWIFTTDISDLPDKGDIGFMADSGILSVKECEVYGLEPMAGTAGK